MQEGREGVGREGPHIEVRTVALHVTLCHPIRGDTTCTKMQGCRAPSLPGLAAGTPPCLGSWKFVSCRGSAGWVVTWHAQHCQTRPPRLPTRYPPLAGRLCYPLPCCSRRRLPNPPLCFALACRAQRWQWGRPGSLLLDPDAAGSGPVGTSAPRHQGPHVRRADRAGPAACGRQGAAAGAR